MKNFWKRCGRLSCAVAILSSFIIVCSTIAMLYLDINLNIKNQNLLLFIKEKVAYVDEKGDIKI